MHLRYALGLHWDMFINNFFTKLYIPTLYSFQKERFNARSQCFPFGGEVKNAIEERDSHAKISSCVWRMWGVKSIYSSHTSPTHAKVGKI